MAVAGGADGEHLPPGLAGGGELVDEGAGGGAQVATAGGAGEGRGMEEDPGAALGQGGDHGSGDGVPDAEMRFHTIFGGELRLAGGTNGGAT
jgi:hypothetical protein